MGMGLRFVWFHLSPENHAAMHRFAGRVFHAIDCRDALFLWRWRLTNTARKQWHTGRNLYVDSNSHDKPSHANPKPDTRRTVDVMKVNLENKRRAR